MQGLVLGSTKKKGTITALVDSDDVHCLMIGASGVGKTAFFLYPNLEYACASGMSFLALDTKGDLARNYGTIAKKYYGYNVSVIDLRNPTRSDGNNLLTLVNCYMDIARKKPDDLAARAKAVYMYLYDRADAEGKCWPGIKTIAADLCLSRSTVKRALNDLVDKGYLLKEERHRPNGSLTSNLYTLR